MRKFIKIYSTSIVKDLTTTAKIEDDDLIAEDKIHAQL